FSKPLSQVLGTAFQRCQLLASMLNTFLEHLCLLDIDSKLITIFSTSIICTREMHQNCILIYFCILCILNCLF
uniref:Uncharacterized protein n=1 Tax=Gopherus evgoodei TaxID=1825980 RepID=A0A8C4W7Y4_9SAUR